MGKQTGIAWCDSTFNPWWGCTRVSPACDNCYAEATAARWLKGGLWGAEIPRREMSTNYWRQPLNWEQNALRDGRTQRVFCASMADVFDKAAPDGAREKLWELIRATPHLDWLLLTKRVGNVASMLPADWGAGYHNVWLGITVVTQAEIDRDVPKLLSLPARVRWLSIEPLLEGVTLQHLTLSPDYDWRHQKAGAGLLDWIVVGGESGPHARVLLTSWVEQLMEECLEADTAFFFKQGSQANWPDFKNFDAFPKKLQVRQFPALLS